MRELSVKTQVIKSAAEIEQEHGLDIEEALCRWEYSGASLKEPESSIWASVAFLFSRRLRSIYEVCSPAENRVSRAKRSK